MVLADPISGKEVFLQTKDVSNFVAMELEWPLARTCSCCDRRNQFIIEMRKLLDTLGVS